MSYNAPVMYDVRNIYNASFNPSTIHTKNTALFWYYCDYLFKKILSVFEFKGLPKTWAENYFKYVLFGYGFIAVYKDSKYGVIPQNCSLSDTYTIFYQPKRVLIANPVLKKSIELEVGKDCEIIKVQPDYHSVLDIVSYYADMLAVSSEAMGMNLLNSKVSYVFMAENKAQAETFKKAYDRLASGDPFVVIDKSLMNEDGSVNWQMFEQNVGQNYIVDRVLNDMKTIEDQFNTKIGIPNANTQKRERLISSEVESNDIDTEALVNVWLDTMKKDMEKVNQVYGLDLSVSYRYANYMKEDTGNGNDVDSGSVQL